MKYHNKYNKYNTLFYVFKINLLNVCVCLCIVFDKADDGDRSEILQKNQESEEAFEPMNVKGKVKPLLSHV